MKESRRKLLYYRFFLPIIGMLFITMLLLSGCQNKSAVEYQSVEELNGKRVGVLTGTALDQFTKEYVKNPELVYSNSPVENAVMLKNGQIDAWAEDEPVAKCILTEFPGLKILAKLTEEQYAFIFQKDNERGTELCRQMNEFLAKCAENGTLEEVEEKWINGGEAGNAVDYSGVDEGPNGILHVGTSSAGKPFDYVKDGAFVGYEVELAVRFCREYGYELKLTDYSSGSLLGAITSGKEDMIMGCYSITEERRQSMLFSDCSYHGGVVLVVSGGTDSDAAIGFVDGIRESFNKTFLIEGRWKLFIAGVGNTLLITILSILLGTLLGFSAFMLCRGGNRLASGITNFITWLIHGMPEVVLLMILFYIIFGKTNLGGVAVSVIGFSLTFGTAVLGMLRMGVSAIDKGQAEAAYTLGFSNIRAFMKIILPQAAKHFMPSFQSEVVSLIKATAIVGYIAVQDLTRMGDIIRSATFEAFFPLIASAVIYFILESILVFCVKRVRVCIDPKSRDKSKILKGVQ